MPADAPSRDAGDPQAAVERRAAARHLVQHPLSCKEHDAEMFRLIRRHGSELDRWFTQRLGYRLHVDADSARLFKTTYVPGGRPLRTPTGRPFGQVEYVLLALVLASTAAGPAVISLRDLVDQVRSAAAEAEIALSDRPPERRALVWALKWMIAQGLAAELHAHVDAYATDETADAVLKLRPDRIAMLPLPNLVGAASRDELLDRADRRDVGRRWMRARLVEDPVLYRRDLDDGEWGELRRRLGEEVAILDEMFGLVLESRAEGMAAVDPGGTLADQRFPTNGTVGHAALLVIDALPSDGSIVPRPVFDAHIASLASDHAKGWANDLVEHPDRLANEVLRLLVDLRLAEIVDDRTGAVNPSSAGSTAGATATPPDGGGQTRLLPDVGDLRNGDPGMAGWTIAPTPSNDLRLDVSDDEPIRWDGEPTPASASASTSASASASASASDSDSDSDSTSAPTSDSTSTDRISGRRRSDPTAAPTSTDGHGQAIRLLPAAGRFLPVVAEPAPASDVEQRALW